MSYFLCAAKEESEKLAARRQTEIVRQESSINQRGKYNCLSYTAKNANKL